MRRITGAHTTGDLGINKAEAVARVPSTPWVAARLVDRPIAPVRPYGVSFVEDSRGRTLALFPSTFTLARLLEDAPPGSLIPVGIDAADPLAEIAT